MGSRHLALGLAFALLAVACSDGAEPPNTATGGSGGVGGGDSSSAGTERPPSLGCAGLTAEAAATALGVTAGRVELRLDDAERGCGYDVEETDADPDLHFLFHREDDADEAAAQLARHIDFEVSILLAGPEDLTGVRADEAVHFPDAGAEADVALVRRGRLWIEVRSPVDAGVVSAVLDALEQDR